MMTLERQARIVIGGCLVLSAMVAWFHWAGLAALIVLGLGLIVTGLMDRCATIALLRPMPWNRRPSDTAPACSADARQQGA
ncbi:MAG: DUF2892 domain-containing protein [Planctomyces sp.]|nr:DUF2892 domain-containing protein [Planctomyces sp.]